MALANHPFSGPIVRALGLPQPRPLKRRSDAFLAQELAGRRVRLDGGDALRELLARAGARVETGPSDAVVIDATACTTAASLDTLFASAQAAVRELVDGGRVLFLASADAGSAEAAGCARAVEGLMRSLAKELGRRGGTANCLYVEEGDLASLQAPIEFFCSGRSAYVSGQALRVAAAAGDRPATGVFGERIAVVTGAAGGIGAATARRLAADGAHVVCVDVPRASAALEAVAAAIGGSTLALDITAADAAARLVETVLARGGVDIVVHNAGITRDRTLARMRPQEWDAVLAVNLRAVLAFDRALDAAAAWKAGAREICLSSISGIAGNVGQCNYGAAKAGLIGYVAARAGEAAQGRTVNAVAPGFIETGMVKSIPFMVREAGRRLNALAQGGRPEDVAEAIAFLARPDARGVNGQVLRVCGQSYLGA